MIRDNSSVLSLAREFNSRKISGETELARRLGLPESLSERVGCYLPGRDRLAEYTAPTLDQLHIRDNGIKPQVSGANFVMTFNQKDKRLYLVPPWHGLNLDPVTPNHAGDYGSGVFEGSSMEPEVVGDELTGGNIILHGPRVARIGWSMQSRFFSSPVEMAAFDLSIRDLAAILGGDVLISAKRQPSRAYIRPSFRPGAGPLGLNLKPEHAIQASVYIMNWPYYFTDPERVYRGSGLTMAAMPVQRLEPIDGKHASNYGGAGKVGREAANLGVDEAIYFGPYLVNGRWNNRSAGEQINFREPGRFDKNYRQTVLADGPGEGLIGFTADGTMVTPPLDVNQLPSTTMMHVAGYIARDLGMAVVERPFCLQDISDGAIVGLAYVGNAARVAPIGQIMVHNNSGSQRPRETFRLDVTLAQKVSQFFEAEVTGAIDSSDSNLLTPVNISEGGEINQWLKTKVYSPYFS